MAKSTRTTAKEFTQRLAAARRTLERLPVEGARELPVVRGVSPSFSVSGTVENKLQEIGRLLINSKRIFSYHDLTVMEFDDGDKKGLVTLALAGDMQRGVEGQLANILAFETTGRDGEPRQFSPTVAITRPMLAHEPTRQRLPRIRCYGKRPLFDSSWNFCGPGFHERDGLLIHCEDFTLEPTPPPHIDISRPVLERLPPRLKTLLGSFCFASDADAANAVAMFITALCVNHFVRDGHPLILLDGNQPGVGKTLLARTLGVVIDGLDPRVLTFQPNEEELAKQVCAHVREHRQSLLLFDNAKSSRGKHLTNSWLEAHCTASELTLRILGTSGNFSCENHFVWLVTMNQTNASPDLVSRAMPIRLRFTGDASQRDFKGFSPLEFARQHRREILVELFGLVMNWLAAGRPPGEYRHRLANWARTVGGILTVNKFPEFIGNWEETVASFNTELDQLIHLAEEAVASGSLCIYLRDTDPSGPADDKLKEIGKAPKDWYGLFRKINLLFTDADSTESRTSIGKRIGEFLARYENRTVEITANSGATWRATLRRRKGRSNASLFYFEIAGREPPRVSVPPVREFSTPGASRRNAARVHAPRKYPLPQILRDRGGDNGETW